MEMPNDLRELYMEFGIASEKAQLLEIEAGNVLLLHLSLFFRKEDITPEIAQLFQDLMDDLNTKTLGKLLTFIRQQSTVDDSIDDTLRIALKNRNHLSHHFFRTHNFAINGSEGRKVMIDELKEIQKKLNQALIALSGISSTMMELGKKLAGHTFDDPEEMGLQLQAKAKRIKM